MQMTDDGGTAHNVLVTHSHLKTILKVNFPENIFFRRFVISLCMNFHQKFENSENSADVTNGFAHHCNVLCVAITNGYSLATPQYLLFSFLLNEQFMEKHSSEWKMLYK